MRRSSAHHIGLKTLGCPTSVLAVAQVRRWRWSTASRPCPCRASRPPAPSSALPASCRRALAAPLVPPCRQVDGRGKGCCCPYGWTENAGVPLSGGSCLAALARGRPALCSPGRGPHPRHRCAPDRVLVAAVVDDDVPTVGDEVLTPPKARTAASGGAAAAAIACQAPGRGPEGGRLKHMQLERAGMRGLQTAAAAAAGPARHPAAPGRGEAAAAAAAAARQRRRPPPGAAARRRAHPDHRRACGARAGAAVRGGHVVPRGPAAAALGQGGPRFPAMLFDPAASLLRPLVLGSELLNSGRTSTLITTDRQRLQDHGFLTSAQVRCVRADWLAHAMRGPPWWLGRTFCDAVTSADLSLRAQVDSCTPNVECFSNSNYNDSMSAVVAIYAINLSLGAMALCTGGSQPHDADAADTPCAFTGCEQTRGCLNGVLHLCECCAAG